MEPLAESSSGHQASRVLVDDYHLVLHHNIMDILLEEAIGSQELRDIMDRLAFYRKALLELLFLYNFFLRRKRFIGIYVVQGS